MPGSSKKVSVILKQNNELFAIWTSVIFIFYYTFKFFPISSILFSYPTNTNTDARVAYRKRNYLLQANIKAALYGIFVGRWQHTFPKIGGNMSSIDKTGSVDYRSPRKRMK